MRKQCLTLLEGLILFLMGASLFLYPTQSAQGARVGVNLCLELLIPSLFPFFVLSSLFIATGFLQICSKPTEGMMRRVFGVSGPGAAAFCLGLIGGYPAGARAVAPQHLHRPAVGQQDVFGDAHHGLVVVVLKGCVNSCHQPQATEHLGLVEGEPVPHPARQGFGYDLRRGCGPDEANGPEGLPVFHQLGPGAARGYWQGQRGGHPILPGFLRRAAENLGGRCGCAPQEIFGEGGHNLSSLYFKNPPPGVRRRIAKKKYLPRQTGTEGR